MAKYFISADIEGITGVASKAFSMSTGGKHYELARRYMIHDVNAVVKGILSKDPNAYIVVRDAHGDATNLDLERLHPKAHLLQGWGNCINMMSGLDKSFKAVFLVGYHAGGENNHAVLSHTFSSSLHEVKINGQFANEGTFAKIYADHFKVPVAFLSGDNHAVNEAKRWFQGATFCTTKQSFGRDATLSKPLSLSAIDLEQSAGKAVETYKTIKLKNVHFPAKVTVKLYSTGYGVSIFENIKGVLEFDKNFKFNSKDFTVTYRAKNNLEIFNRFNLITNLIYGASLLAAR